jgi:hypothetical protein
VKINWSLLVSFAVHAAILLFGLVALPNPSEHKISEPPPIAVNIEDFQDVAKRANQTTEPVEAGAQAGRKAEGAEGREEDRQADAEAGQGNQAGRSRAAGPARSKAGAKARAAQACRNTA